MARDKILMTFAYFSLSAIQFQPKTKLFLLYNNLECVIFILHFCVKCISLYLYGHFFYKL